jgi:hypothetical protein
VSESDRRCRRGERCTHRDRIDTGTDNDEPQFEGALLEDPRDGFCPACTTKLELALTELPRLFVAVHLLHNPSLAVKYRTDDIVAGTDPASPVLVNDFADALTRLLDHELSTWAEVVADIADVPWDSQLAAASRSGHRLQQACDLLQYRVVQWLRAGEHEYPARSLTEDPTAGHDPDTTTRYGRDWWCHRDGPAAAILVLRLHHQALRVTGGAPSDWVPTPCGYCHQRKLYREHHTLDVVCRACGDRKSYGAHEAFLEAALEAVLASQAAAA